MRGRLDVAGGLGFGLSVLAGLAVPTSAAQGQLGQVLQAVANGGSWVRFQVEAGRGSYRSPRLPVVGMTLDGCFQVWQGHSGTWTIRAKDLHGTAEIDVTAAPGEPVEFSYEGGFTAEIDLAIEWSEARDTVMIAWVGLAALAGEEGERDICQPPAGNEDASGALGDAARRANQPSRVQDRLFARPAPTTDKDRATRLVPARQSRRRPIAASRVRSSSTWVPHKTAAPATMITDG